MSGTDAPEAFAEAAAALVGLPLAPAHLPGVASNLAIAARMAAVVEAVTLEVHDEPAPVFRP